MIEQVLIIRSRRDRHVAVSTAASEGISRESQQQRLRSSVTVKQHAEDTGTTWKKRMRVKLHKELETLRKTFVTQNSSDTADPLQTKLTQYHYRLYSESDNISSQKLTGGGDSTPLLLVCPICRLFVQFVCPMSAVRESYQLSMSSRVFSLLLTYLWLQGVTRDVKCLSRIVLLLNWQSSWVQSR